MTLREIDALVHEKFFGLSPSETPKEYTKDWEAIQPIAKALHDEWPDFSISGTAQGHWRVCWGFDGHGWNWKDASTCQLALCIAALSSKEYEIEPPYENEETK